jgi:glycosyltransferase 2 family protein
MKKSARRWLGLGVTAAALALVVYNLYQSPEWRTFDWARLGRSLAHARRGYLAAAVIATLVSYWVRAYRWRFFMEPFKKASLWILFVAQVFGFASIYLIGRPGELVRPTYIARREGVPVSSMLAILVLERVYDTVFMIIMFAVALHYAPLELRGVHGHTILTWLHRASRFGMLAMAVAIAVLLVIRLRADDLAEFSGNRLGFLPARVRRGLKKAFYSFAEGLDVIRNWNDLVASLITSAVVWTVNISMVWFVFQSLGGPLGDLNWMAAALVLFCAALGLFAQLPGIGGGYQALAIGAMHYLLGVHREVATGAAILMWIVMLVPCLALAFVLLLYEGLSFKKLTAIAREEQEGATAHEKAAR